MNLENKIPRTKKQFNLSFEQRSPILRFSYCEVRKPQTLNYRPIEPERAGLFCAKFQNPV